MLVPAAPPAQVPVFSGFDYVTVDAVHRRVYAAHGGSRALLIADADSGAVLGQVRVGPMRGVAFDPESGHVYTANGDDGTVTEVDPATMKVVRSVKLDASLDAMIYDAATKRLYVDEDNGSRLFVVDTATFTLAKTVKLPGSKAEYLAVDPRTHDVYQNIDDLAEVAVIDGKSLEVTRTFKTPDLQHNHPLQFDPAYRFIVTGGNGMLVSYAPDGTKRGSLATPRIDQCDLDPGTHILACAGGAAITRVAIARDGTLTVVDSTPVDPGVHTLAVDPKTHAVFAVWGKRDGSGDFIQKLTPQP